MTPLLSLVAYMAIVTWASLLAANLIRAEGWTLPRMMLAMGNGDVSADTEEVLAKLPTG